MTNNIGLDIVVRGQELWELYRSVMPLRPYLDSHAARGGATVGDYEWVNVIREMLRM